MVPRMGARVDGFAAGVLAAMLAAGLAAQTIRPGDGTDRAMLLSLVAAVDAAQARAESDDGAFAWNHHILKSIDRNAFVPFRVFPPDGFKSPKNGVMYVRAVSRHDGVPSREERSFIRDWLVHNATAPPGRGDTVFVPAGELPVGGPASTSTRQTTQLAAEASARMRLQERLFEKEREKAEAEKKKQESGEKDPLRFPFEEYYTLGGSPPFERAMALPAGEYDVFVALPPRAGSNAAPSVTRHTLTIPDFWNDQLMLSTVILAKEVRTLASPLARKDQASHPYTFGHAQVLPVDSPVFSPRDVLSIVFQICNYGAPETDLTADYVFYRLDGGRRIFNSTQPQHLSDEDLPVQKDLWQTQAFATQAVPLAPFPAGSYELELTVHDRLTRATAKASATFSVK
jgi:hypothetical protein